MKIFKLNYRNKIFCVFIFSFFAFFIENAVCEQPKKREYWPTSGWKTSTPKQQGMDSAKLLVADEFIQNTINSIPVKRLGKPKEIASTIEFLINNEYVNGSTLKLTGGL